jgi:hypothetical protein
LFYEPSAPEFVVFLPMMVDPSGSLTDYRYTG